MRKFRKGGGKRRKERRRRGARRRHTERYKQELETRETESEGETKRTDSYQRREVERGRKQKDAGGREVEVRTGRREQEGEE